MTTPHPYDPESRVAGAYTWAAGLVGLARRLVADGLDVDLEPIRPAVRELCQGIRELPSDEASAWLKHLIDLQREMTALARALAERDAIHLSDGGDER